MNSGISMVILSFLSFTGALELPAFDSLGVQHGGWS
jgi:hypothetical protein